MGNTTPAGAPQGTWHVRAHALAVPRTRVAAKRFWNFWNNFNAKPIPAVGRGPGPPPIVNYLPGNFSRAELAVLAELAKRGANLSGG